MKLLIDIGNSRTKYAVLEGEILLPGKAVENSKPINELFAALTPPDEVYVCCVGSDAQFDRLTAWVEHNWGSPTIRLHTQQQCGGVVNGYVVPERLGVDRWAAIIGAYQLVRGAVVVIDCGTACTADLIDEDGQHLGGAMMPGRMLLQRSLSTGTAAIENGTVQSPRAQNLGTDTAGCIALGVELGLKGFIDGVRQRAEQVLKEPYTVVLTGGDAALLHEQQDGEVRYEKDLVFYGMTAMVAQKRGGA